MVGFIASVSRPFCLNCNRLRLTADGKLRYCLFAIEEDDVKTLMRSGASDEEIAALVRRNVAGSGSATKSTRRNSCPPAPHVLHRRRRTGLPGLSSNSKVELQSELQIPRALRRVDHASGNPAV